MTLAGRRFARLSWVGAPANSFGIQRAFESQLGFGLWDGSRLPTSTEAIGAHAEPRQTAQRLTRASRLSLSRNLRHGSCATSTFNARE